MFNLVNTDAARYQGKEINRRGDWTGNLRQWGLVTSLATLAVIAAAVVISNWATITSWIVPETVKPVAPTAFYAVSDEGRLLTSTDGETWQPLETQLMSRITAILAQSGILYAGSESAGLCRSDDGGRTWISLSDNMALPMPTATITALTGGAEQGTIYAAIGYWLGTSAAHLAPAGVYATMDGGDTWTKMEGPTASGAISALVADKEYPGVVYAQIKDCDTLVTYRTQ